MKKALYFLCLIHIVIGISLPPMRTVYDFHDLYWLSEDMDLKDNVQLHLYTNKKDNIPYLLNFKNIDNATLLFNHPIKILIHGKSSSGHDNELIRLKNEIFKHEENLNIIIVDYGNYAYLEYPVACIKTRFVGAYIGQVLLYLFQDNKIRLEEIHIIGRCIGAHIAGFIGKTVIAQIGRKIGRITGLDPAAPFFEKPVLVHANDRLDKDDAMFIDVIHTTAGSFGFQKTLGHADFYPNGGFPTQPGCVNEVYPYSCSQSMAVIFYIQSINLFKFRAIPCESWSEFVMKKCSRRRNSKRIERYARMGYFVDTYRSNGKYYLSTV